MNTPTALEALREVRRVLEAENERPGGAICDTIWRGNGETLFDYIDNALAQPAESAEAGAAPAGCIFQVTTTDDPSAWRDTSEKEHAWYVANPGGWKTRILYTAAPALEFQRRRSEAWIAVCDALIKHWGNGALSEGAPGVVRLVELLAQEANAYRAAGRPPPVAASPAAPAPQPAGMVGLTADEAVKALRFGYSSLAMADRVVAAFCAKNGLALAEKREGAEKP